jgi:hypothetical protein
MSRYVRLCKGLNEHGILVAEDDVQHRIDDKNDWYQSIMYYNDAHKQIFDVKGSIKGIRDVTTNKLVFDFDSGDSIKNSQADAARLVEKLRDRGVNTESVYIYYSGSKGFHVVVPLDREVSPDNARALAEKYAGDLGTWDTKIYDPARLLRIPGTKHQSSGRFKTPLSFEQLHALSIPEIMDMATVPYDEAERPKQCLPPDFYNLPPKKEVKIAAPQYKIDLTQKAPGWRNCKWSLLQGNFKAGERSQALMVLAATCRGLKYSRDTSYYMCKSALKKSWELYGEGEFNKQELWDKIITQVFVEDGWQGGTYSCKTHPWMHDYCKSLGDSACKEQDEDKPSVSLNDMGKQFLDYATNFETNVIKTGIAELDENATLCASTLNGLLGQPGAGKTTVAIQYLRNTSLGNVPSMFFSLDMGLPIVYAKLVQKLTGLDFKSVMALYREDPMKAAEFAVIIQEEYRNVGFNFRTGMTIADMKNAIRQQQEDIGRAVKLIVIDYLECIAGPYPDATANTGFIANQLKDLANDFGACVLLLLQTQKHSTPQISDPLMTLKAVKGSSVIEQSCSTILTLWREGYNPDTIEQDRYMSFAVVKNRFGSLWRGDFSWDGVRGSINSLSDEERDCLRSFKSQKEQRAFAQAQQAAGIRPKGTGFKQPEGNFGIDWDL